MSGQISSKILYDSSLIVHLDALNVNSYPNTGVNWYDIIGNANGVLRNGPSYSDDRKSFTFDGTNDYVSFINQTQFLIPTFTVCSWISPLYFEAQGTAVFTIGDSSRLILGLNYGTSGGSSGGIYFRIVGTGGTLDVYTSVSYVTLGNWYNYAYVVDMLNSNIKGYINGNQVYSYTNNIGSDFANGIGSYPGVLASRYGGASNRANIKMSTFSPMAPLLATKPAAQPKPTS
jgi:hypothetical protein